MRVCVVGAGAIGGWIAARLALAGNEVMALTSSGALDRIEIDEGGKTETAGLARFDGPAELLVIAVKAPALADAAQGARTLTGADTLVVPMLNGVPWWFTGEPLRSVDPDGSIAAALPLERIIGCVVHASCRRADAGRIEVVHAEKLIFGEPGGGRASASSSCALCSRRLGSAARRARTCAGRSGTNYGAMRRSTRCRR